MNRARPTSPTNALESSQELPVANASSFAPCSYFKKLEKQFSTLTFVVSYEHGAKEKNSVKPLS